MGRLLLRIGCVRPRRALAGRVHPPRRPPVVDLDRGRATLLEGSEDATPTGGQPSLGWASNGWLFFLASGPTTTIAAWRPGDRTAGLVWLDGDRVLDTIPRALAPN